MCVPEAVRTSGRHLRFAVDPGPSPASIVHLASTTWRNSTVSLQNLVPSDIIPLFTRVRNDNDTRRSPFVMTTAPREWAFLSRDAARDRGIYASCGCPGDALSGLGAYKDWVQRWIAHSMGVIATACQAAGSASVCLALGALMFA